MLNLSKLDALRMTRFELVCSRPTLYWLVRGRGLSLRYLRVVSFSSKSFFLIWSDMRPTTNWSLRRLSSWSPNLQSIEEWRRSARYSSTDFPSCWTIDKKRTRCEFWNFLTEGTIEVCDEIVEIHCREFVRKMKIGEHTVCGVSDES